MAQQAIPQNCDISQYNSLVTNALSAVQTVINASQLAIAIMAVILGIMGLIGFRALYKKCLSVAEARADKRLAEYLETEKFQAALETKISKGIDDKLRTNIVVHLQPDNNHGRGSGGFPEKSKDNGS